jgi:hypothetical protein
MICKYQCLHGCGYPCYYGWRIRINTDGKNLGSLVYPMSSAKIEAQKTPNATRPYAQITSPKFQVSGLRFQVNKLDPSTFQPYNLYIYQPYKISGRCFQTGLFTHAAPAT